MDESTLRRIIRDEFQRATFTDPWIDGCSYCGAPTHGSWTVCPYIRLLGGPCTVAKYHDVEVIEDTPLRQEFKCRACGSWGWNERRAPSITPTRTAP